MRHVASVLIGAALLLAAPAAPAFEFFDGRLEVHGFYETQLRAISRDFSFGDEEWDLTQWWHILNFEAEADLAPDGFGPFDVLQAFARVEVRYDCVWTRACGLAPSADMFGNRPEKISRRLQQGRRQGLRSSGAVNNGDFRAFRGITREQLGFEFSRWDPANPALPAFSTTQPRRPNRDFNTSAWWNIQGLDTLFDTAGEDELFGTADDPAPFYFSRQMGRGLDPDPATFYTDEGLEPPQSLFVEGILRQPESCFFNFRRTRGSFDGRGNQILGPWDPDCRIRRIGALAPKGHPLSPLDVDAGLVSPVLDPGQAQGPLPFRPVPFQPANVEAPKDVPRGIYYPNAKLAQKLRNGAFDPFEQNLRQSELAWNRGQSQQDEKELKEAYLDIEMFDSRLWLRLGKQQIVWGKTELFRNQDQWNPQDLALASLPSLEESRISLWSARGVWSFYEVGPFEDVRLELALLYDQFEPIDLGRCGEPYTPNPACNVTFGHYVHGLTGFGIAGEERPPDPWDSASGTEFGARIEWRWQRLSFAVTEYYGYQDLFFQDQIFRYSRNVDPLTGRPRNTMATGSCTTGLEAACLLPVTDLASAGVPGNALTDHSVNQQLFTMICATSVGLLPSLDPGACGQSLFNSQRAIPGIGFFSSVASLITNTLAGNLAARNALLDGLAGTGPGTFGQYVLPLVEDTGGPGVGCDGLLADCVTPANGPGEVNESDPAFGFPFPTFNEVTTSQQKALLGCGEFYDTNCELAGIDLMNTEASALFQSFPGFEGTFGVFEDAWNTTVVVAPDGSPLAQPGTLGFVGGTPCLRFEAGTSSILPGCRPITDPDYDPGIDGTTGGAQHPFAGAGPDRMLGTPDDIPADYQFFRSEMAVLSWNALAALVVLSSPNDLDGDGTDDPTIATFDAADAFRTDGCSLATPNYCSNVQSLFQVTGVQRKSTRAGGNGRFGRRDFVWQGGRDVSLAYEKRNVLGFSMDVAEDVTKSNWSFEFTWQNGLTFQDNDSFDGVKTGVDTYNLTISVDRPTFINFLNANRTFFMNTQWFLQYVDGYSKGFTSNGPWNILGVAIVETGYFDDRLITRMTGVYDVKSNSAAFIPQVTYRFSSDFSATFGVALFAGREQSKRMPFSPTSLSNRAGSHAYADYVENGLSAIRDRDEVFLRIRYSF